MKDENNNDIILEESKKTPILKTIKARSKKWVFTY